MKDLARYLELIVDPTFAEFEKNPKSVRHAYLACVAIYHAIDRMSEKVGIRKDLRKQWGAKSVEFKLVDIVTHHFKHVRSDDEKHPPRLPGVPLTSLLELNEAGDSMELRNLFFAARDAVKFVRQEAQASGLLRETTQ